MGPGGEPSTTGRPGRPASPATPSRWDNVSHEALEHRELHRRTGAVVEQVARGDSVVMEKRGVPLAEMRPLRPAGRGFPSGHWEFLKRFPKFKDDSGQLISKDRERG